ncbi:60S ribosomal protein L14 [Thamnocephalis sphaerospora]|uniref:60S ribosomal protein L14 n=1 Tax=Thamnocephalis sphaerospora TaxID=78915 RepID=A0A4V1IWU3_9FUNG|nr:60S ribosomal protein L14 [Thamnocephalis sphaerospora]|eukprot:RKP08759.1 60S ribosomal protein L14 [Thamnocephalis sphaerospora]
MASVDYGRTCSNFARMVEVGRVVVLSYGSDTGKLAVIVDIVDHNRVLVDGPTTGVVRQAIGLKRVTLTPLVLKKLPRAVRTSTLRKVIEAQNLSEQWAKTAWAKKIAARETRKSLSDFDRFKVMRLKKQVRNVINVEVAKLKKQK